MGHSTVRIEDPPTRSRRLASRGAASVGGNGEDRRTPSGLALDGRCSDGYDRRDRGAPGSPLHPEISAQQGPRCRRLPNKRDGNINVESEHPKTPPHTGTYHLVHGTLEITSVDYRFDGHIEGLLDADLAGGSTDSGIRVHLRVRFRADLPLRG